MAARWLDSSGGHRNQGLQRPTARAEMERGGDGDGGAHVGDGGTRKDGQRRNSGSQQRRCSDGAPTRTTHTRRRTWHSKAKGEDDGGRDLQTVALMVAAKW